MAERTLRIFVTPLDEQDRPDQSRTKKFELTGPGVFQFGRSPECELQLDHPHVSSLHFQLEITEDAIHVEDVGSTNGTIIAGEEIARTRWNGNAPIEVPGFQITTSSGAENREPKKKTRVRRSALEDSQGFSSIVTDDSAAPVTTGHFPDSVFGKDPVVPISRIKQGNHIVQEVNYCAVGAGLGSFTWVDHLRVYGVSASNIRTIGLDPTCYYNYKRYCKNSQIPDHERLRSNSISTPDNIWGFPGYASRESVRGMKSGRFGDIRYAVQVFGEPTLAESYTPRARDVFASLDVEMERIGWRDMFIQGRVISVRKTDDERYAVAYRKVALDGSGRGQQRDCILICRCLHLATGYPATKFIDDFQKFLINHSTEKNLVKNAYDPHDAIYEQAERSGQEEYFVVRGRGIVASRIIQRIHEARQKNPKIKLIQSIRTPLSANQGSTFGKSRRIVRGNVELQPFNWPKSCWGGELRAELENADQQKRSEMLRRMGGTTTAERSDWIEMVERGTEEGWYRPVFGNINKMEPTGESNNRKVRLTIETPEGHNEIINADHLVDCTGLIAEVNLSPFLRDMIETYNLPRHKAYRETKDGTKTNDTGLEVSPDFELRAMANGKGRVYGSGTIVQGGPYAAVDSFLGLQYTALRSVDHLGRSGYPGVSSFGPAKSFSQWLKWCRGVAP